jgi:hypothetical protein
MIPIAEPDRAGAVQYQPPRDKKAFRYPLLTRAAR